MRRSRLIAASFLAWTLAPAAALSAAEPVLALSLNLGLATDAVPGAPLIVTGSLASSGSTGDAPLVIAPAHGTWFDAVEVVLTKPDGTRAAPSFVPAGVAAEPALALPGRARVRLLWTLSAAAVGSLPPGRYSLRARLAVPQGAAGSWTGTAESQEISFEVPRATGGDDRRVRRPRALLVANLAAVDGDFPAAESGLRAFIRADPACVAAHRLLGEVLLARGAFLEAFLAASDAARLWTQANPETPLPPPEIADVGQRAIRRILAATPPAAPEPLPRQPSRPPVKPAPQIAPAPSPPKITPAGDPQANALRDYQDTVSKGDALLAAGDFFEAVLAYERAWRVRYNNKLDVPAAGLDERLARARKARDEKKKR
ncbi:MAG TPA: hypothetical protein VN317_03870 [Candidatus Methanoperedens sp.]|nr:hypothetical protein [Candidatus Methanoperedens sp.]